MSSDSRLLLGFSLSTMVNGIFLFLSRVLASGGVLELVYFFSSS